MDDRLREYIEDGKLIVSIGIDRLAFCLNEHPGLYDGENDRNLFKVTDSAIFAKEIKRILQNEDETGATIVTKMLDKAIFEAIEDGCDGVEEVKYVN
jgi:hypothetical protein